MEAVLVPTYHITARYTAAPHTDTDPEPLVGVSPTIDVETRQRSEYLVATLAITAPTGERMFHKFECALRDRPEVSAIEKRVVAYSLRRLGPGVWTFGPAIMAFGKDGVPPLNAFLTITDVPEPAPFETTRIRL